MQSDFTDKCIIFRETFNIGLLANPVLDCRVAHVGGSVLFAKMLCVYRGGGESGDSCVGGSSCCSGGV